MPASAIDKMFCCDQEIFAQSRRLRELEEEREALCADGNIAATKELDAQMKELNTHITHLRCKYQKLCEEERENVQRREKFRELAEAQQLQQIREQYWLMVDWLKKHRFLAEDGGQESLWELFLCDCPANETWEYRD